MYFVSRFRLLPVGGLWYCFWERNVWVHGSLGLSNTLSDLLQVKSQMFYNSPLFAWLQFWLRKVKCHDQGGESAKNHFFTVTHLHLVRIVQIIAEDNDMVVFRHSVVVTYLLLVFGVSFHSVLRPLGSLAQCTSPLQPKVTKTSLWLLRTAKE